VPVLDGKKVIIVIAPLNFRDEEYKVPRQVLEANGAEVKVASSSSPATGVKGLVVNADITVDQIETKDYDALVFVGGPGAIEYFKSPLAHKKAQDAEKAGKVLGAICIGPGILAYAGVLQGKKATSFIAEERTLTTHGCTYTGRDIEVDGNLVTANGPGAAKKFGDELVKALAK
jgi:protease I